MAHVVRKIRTSLKPLEHSPVVDTACGPLQGKVSYSRDGRPYYEYTGIPYAKPPLGKLRFKPPQPWTEPWSQPRDATKDGAKALQFDILSKKVVGSEDCLFLSVYTPQLGPSAQLPVLVWIHGGAYIAGSGNDYRPCYFMEYPVVIVTLNYRLGCFGFLSTFPEGSSSAGNMGLKDQTLALRWVQENISGFGGNRHNVTIAGESAGGASVHYHVLSPMSRGLFSKAISQSGMATMPFSFHPNPLKLTQKFAKLLDIPIRDTSEMVEHLKGVSAQRLASITLGMFDNFRPSLEIELGDGTSFLTRDPQSIIDSGNYNKVPYIVGVNSGEGILVAAPTVGNKETLKSLAANWSETLAKFLFLPDHVDPSVLNPSLELYFNGLFDGNDEKRNMCRFANLFGDWIWNLGFHNGVKAHSDTMTGGDTPLFIYYYDYDGEYSLGDLVQALNGEYHPVVEILRLKGINWFKENILKKKLPKYGSCHGDGLSLQWNMPAMCYVHKRSPDYDISKDVVNNMVQFMRMDPRMENPHLFFSGKKWKAQERGEPLKYMHICASPHRIEEPFADRLHFWQQIDKICKQKAYGWSVPK